MGLGSNYTTGLNSCNWCDRSNNDSPPRRRFQYDKSRELSKNHWDMNTICLNITKKKIIEFDSYDDTFNYFKLPRRDGIPDYFYHDGDIWMILTGYIPEEQQDWFNNLETLFDNAINNLDEEKRNTVKNLLTPPMRRERDDLEE